jgi:hypothetical protein
MSNTQVKDKILSLEAELASLKAATESEPDFAVDEKNWTRVRKAVKKNRQALYQQVYGKK